MFSEWPEKQNPGEDVHCPQPQNIFPALPFSLHASGCFQDVRFKCRQMLKAWEFYCNFHGTYFMFRLTCEHWAVLSVDIHDGFGLGSGLNSNENHPASRQFRLLWEFSEKCNCTPLQVRNNNKSNCKAQWDEGNFQLKDVFELESCLQCMHWLRVQSRCFPRNSTRAQHLHKIPHKNMNCSSSPSSRDH